MIMSHIFISYKRESLSDVEPIVNELKRHHYVWFDQTGIPGGTEWEAKINTALSEATALILMVTPAALGSKWVKYEFETALAKGLLVIPYILEKSKLPSTLRGIQVIQHTDTDAFEKVMDSLPDVSRIWGEHIVASNEMQEGRSLGEVADAFPDGILYPAPGLVGIPIHQTRYCKVYRVGRRNDTLEAQDSYQIGLQLTGRNFGLKADVNGRYPQDDFTGSIVDHFLTSPSKQIQLYLVQGPLNQAYDTKSDKLSFGLNVKRESEWLDVVQATNYARGVASGHTMQLFVIGPAIMTYRLGASNPGFSRYELYQPDYSSTPLTYHRVLKG